MKSEQSWIRRSQRVIRMVSELHRMGYQRLRIMPYEYPIAWRLCVAGARRFHPTNGAYIAEPHLVPSATYSCASQDEYFGWDDASGDNARDLAEKFIERFPEVTSEGLGRDWSYAGWLSELVGFLERGDLLPFVMAEYYEPSPEQLTVLPIRDHAQHAELEFPLPPCPAPIC